MASPDVLWQVLRTTSSFIRKSRNVPVMTAEPGNLTSLNGIKFSGLARSQVVDITPTLRGKKEGIVLTTKSQKEDKLVTPGKIFLTRGVVKNAKKATDALQKAIAGKFVRPDLLKLALVKYAKVRNSFKKRKPSWAKPPKAAKK